MYELLLSLCKENGISITNLCLEITGSRGNLNTWKKGNINPTVLSKIADYFGVSTDYLLGREEKSTTNINTETHSKIDNSTVIGVNKGKQYDETTIQVAEAFSNLDFVDKAKVMSLIAELSDKKGA